VSHTLPTRRGFLQALAAAAVSPALMARVEGAERSLALASSMPFHGSDPESARALGARYMLSPELRYLNHASIGTVPRAVHEAHVAYLETCETHPSLYVWGQIWRDAMEEVRSVAAGLLRCKPDDLAITHNTTEGFNVLAHGVPLERGDEVLFSSLNHPGASVPWQGLAARRGLAAASDGSRRSCGLGGQGGPARRCPRQPRSYPTWSAESTMAERVGFHRARDLL